MIRRSLLIMAALVLVGGVAACGGKGDDSASTTRDKDSVEESVEESSTSASSESTEPGEIGDAATADGPAAETGGATPGSEEAAAPTGNDVPTGDPGDIGTSFDTDYSFTGEGGEAFCAKMAELQSQYANANPESITLSDLADKMEAIDPPPELADDWPGYIEMQRALGAADSEGDLTEADTAQLAEFANASTKVSVYLTDVCGL
jgi:hypothetical protein